MAFHPSIYRRLALQKAKLQNIENLDVFDELADIDYLTNLKIKFSSTSQKLLQRGLIPQNFEELVSSDLKRVSYIRDVFRVKSGTLGGELEGIKKIHEEISLPSFSFDKTDLDKIREKLDSFDNVWREVEPIVSRLHHIYDWTNSGKLETCLDEYYFLEKCEVFFNGTSKYLSSFIISPSRFKDEIEKLIIEVKNIFKRWVEAYQVAQSKEAELNLLCERGDIKSLRAKLSEISQFEGIALREKKQLLLFDRLLEDKSEIQQSVVSLAEESKKDRFIHRHSKYESIVSKSKAFSKEAGFLNQSLQKKLDADGVASVYEKLVKKLELKIKRKKQMFFSIKLTFASILFLAILGYLILQHFEDLRKEAAIAEKARMLELTYKRFQSDKKKELVRILEEESKAFGLPYDEYKGGRWNSSPPYDSYSGLWVVSNFTASVSRPTTVHYLKNGKKDGPSITIDYKTKKIIKKWIYKDGELISKVID